MVEMARRDILPGVISYSRELAETITAKRAVSSNIHCGAERALLSEIAALTDETYERLNTLQSLVDAAKALDGYGSPSTAQHFKRKVLPAMTDLRKAVDALETRAAKSCWPYPSYGKLIYLH